MIYISHGTIHSWSSERISHALFLPASLADQYLRTRTEKYVPLAQALEGHGDALTIDDASYGALELALIARRHGHAVSWFVNGGHVENGLAYYPFQISAMLDDTKVHQCRFDGRTWHLDNAISRRAMRRYLKDCYMRVRRQEEIEVLLERLASCLCVNSLPVEIALTTVTSSDLARAVAEGIDLQNHGWTHLNPASLFEEQYVSEALKNEEYLTQFRYTETHIFAPAFGQYAGNPFAHTHFALLADRNLVQGYCDGKLVNRAQLVPEMWKHESKTFLSSGQGVRAA